ncbi:transposase [Evansella sp. LMS18]
MMFKYLLLKTIHDLSGVDIVERSKYDMSFKYFLDMTSLILKNVRGAH